MGIMPERKDIDYFGAVCKAACMKPAFALRRRNLWLLGMILGCWADGVAHAQMLSVAKAPDGGGLPPQPALSVYGCTRKAWCA